MSKFRRTPEEIRQYRDGLALEAEADALGAMREGRLVTKVNGAGRSVLGAYELLQRAARWWLDGALCEADLDAEEERLSRLEQTPGVVVALGMIVDEKSRRYHFQTYGA